MALMIDLKGDMKMNKQKILDNIEGARFEPQTCVSVERLRYHTHKLSDSDNDNSHSSVQFSIRSESVHRVMNVHSNENTEFQYRHYITGPAVQIDHLPLNSMACYSLIKDQMLSLLDPQLMRVPDIQLLAHQIIFNTNIIIADNNTDAHPKLWLFDVEIRITTVIGLQGDELDDYERLFFQSSALHASHINNKGNLPTKWLSIALLKQVAAAPTYYNGDGDGDISCSICFGQLGETSSSYVTRMPCLHVFHPKCIVKWLNQSHSCPICRFQMPSRKSITQPERYDVID